MVLQRKNDENRTQTTIIPLSKFEAFLAYNGAPDSDDDPADYYEYPKGVRLA